MAKTAFIYNTQASNILNQKVQLLFTHMVSEPMTISAKPFVVLNFDIFVRVGEFRTFKVDNDLKGFSFPGNEGGLSIHCSFQELLQII